MYAVLFVGFMATALAAELNVNFEENGQIFQEKFNFDSLQNVEIIKVPAHGNIQKAEILNDFDRGFSARRIDSLKKCFISVLEKDEQTPSELERSLRLANSTLGTGEFLVKKYRALPMYEMNSEEVGEKIALHCTGVKLVFTERFLDSDINKKAAELIKGLELRAKSPARRLRRERILNFKFCRPIEDANQFFRCKDKSKLDVSCSFQASGHSCVYDVSCTPGERWFDCTKRHVMDSVLCCSVKCKTPLMAMEVKL